MDTKRQYATAVLLAAVLLPAAASAQTCQSAAQEVLEPTGEGTPPVHRLGNVRYLTGGIGADEAALMRTERSRYPLALTLSQNGPDGRAIFLTNVHAVLRGADGTAVFCTVDAGPYLFISVAPGRYRVELTTQDGRVQQRELQLQAGKRQDLSILWPAKPEVQRPLVKPQGPVVIEVPPRPAPTVPAPAPAPAAMPPPAAAPVVVPPAPQPAPPPPVTISPPPATYPPSQPPPPPRRVTQPSAPLPYDLSKDPRFSSAPSPAQEDGGIAGPAQTLPSGDIAPTAPPQ